MTHVSIYAQTRQQRISRIFEFFLIELAKFVQIGNRKTITTIRLFAFYVKIQIF